MKQTQIVSLIEASTNTIVGVILSFLVSKILYIHYGIEITNTQITILTIVLTFLSIVRNYLIRRVFNK